MDATRDITDFRRRAEIAYGAMREAKGQSAAFCRDDARFYLECAIEIAKVSGRKDMVARLKLRRAQIIGAFEKQQGSITPPHQQTSIDRWENEGGAIDPWPHKSHG